MCVALPGLLLEIHEVGPTRTATVELGDQRREIDLAFTPEAEVGSYVVTHSGFAVRVLDAAEAEATRRLLDEAYED